MVFSFLIPSAEKAVGWTCLWRGLFCQKLCTSSTVNIPILGNWAEGTYGLLEGSEETCSLGDWGVGWVYDGKGD